MHKLKIVHNVYNEYLASISISVTRFIWIINNLNACCFGEVLFPRAAETDRDCSYHIFHIYRKRPRLNLKFSLNLAVWILIKNIQQ